MSISASRSRKWDSPVARLQTPWWPVKIPSKSASSASSARSAVKSLWAGCQSALSPFLPHSNAEIDSRRQRLTFCRVMHSLQFVVRFAFAAFALLSRPCIAADQSTKADKQRQRVPSEQMARGEKIFAEKCVLCHQTAGQGVPGVYPPLAKSDWLMQNRARAIKVLCEGLSGQIEVGGVAYNNVMPAQILDDAQVADVLTYVSNAWDGAFAPFAARRRESRARKLPLSDLRIAQEGFRVSTASESAGWICAAGGGAGARVSHPPRWRRSGKERLRAGANRNHLLPGSAGWRACADHQVRRIHGSETRRLRNPRPHPG